MSHYYDKDNQHYYDILQNILHILSHLNLTIFNIEIIFSHFTCRRKKVHLHNYVAEMNMKAIFFTPHHHFSNIPQYLTPSSTLSFLLDLICSSYEITSGLMF